MQRWQKKYIIFIRKYGYKVILTSCMENKGIEEIKKVLQNNISAFAGCSGVRKVNTYK